MDTRSEIEIRERQTRTEADVHHLVDQQRVNSGWIARLSTRVQHLEGQIPHIHKINGRVETLESHSKITRQERERRQLVRDWAMHVVTVLIGGAVLLGWLGKGTGDYILTAAGLK